MLSLLLAASLFSALVLPVCWFWSVRVFDHVEQCGCVCCSAHRVGKGIMVVMRVCSCMGCLCVCSAHADGKGIMQMIRRVDPRNVVLVHGECGKMKLFKNKVAETLALPCFDPPNNCPV